MVNVVLKDKPFKKKGITFPILMQWTGTGSKPIVLFTSFKKGTLLSKDHITREFCNVYDEWTSCDNDNWKKFEGEVILSNGDK